MDETTAVCFRTLAALKADVVARDREWRSELDELVQKIDATFSKFFSLLGCGGKVTLYTGEAQHQYDRYSKSLIICASVYISDYSICFAVFAI